MPLLKRVEGRPHILQMTKAVAGPAAGEPVPQDRDIGFFRAPGEWSEVIYTRRKMTFGPNHVIAFYCPENMDSDQSHRAAIEALVAYMVGGETGEPKSGDFIGDDLTGIHTCYAECPCHSKSCPTDPEKLE